MVGLVACPANHHHHLHYKHSNCDEEIAVVSIKQFTGLISKFKDDLMNLVTSEYQDVPLVNNHQIVKLIIDRFSTKTEYFTVKDIVALHCLKVFRDDHCDVDNDSSSNSQLLDNDWLEKLACSIDEYKQEIEASSLIIPEKISKLVNDGSIVLIAGNFDQFDLFFKRAIKNRKNVTYVLVNSVVENSFTSIYEDQLKTNKSELKTVSFMNAINYIPKASNVFILPETVFFNSSMIVSPEAQSLVIYLRDFLNELQFETLVKSVYFIHQVLPQFAYNYENRNILHLESNLFTGNSKVNPLSSEDMHMNYSFKTQSLISGKHCVQNSITNIAGPMANIYVTMYKKFIFLQDVQTMHKMKRELGTNL